MLGFVEFNMKSTTTLLFLTLIFIGCQAQDKTRKHTRLIEDLANKLKKNYVFEKEAIAMHDLLLSNLKNGKYESFEEGPELGEALHNDLRSVVNDKHLRVRYGNRPSAPTKFAGRQIKRLTNGMGEVEILKDNVGYLELTGFHSPNGSYRKSLTQKINSLKGTKAIILDLRNNSGGSPESVRLISSYFFPEGEQVHLNSLYYRNRDAKMDFYTLKKVDGPRLSDVPIYLLTSDFTFSAGEEFCYNLKNLKRATLVGETTGGGAHPVNRYEFSEEIVAIIPEGRAINPITGTNWEGVGVVPHYEVDEDEAMEKVLELIEGEVK